MRFDFLIFDQSDDTDGHGSFDAMASCTPAQLPKLEAELARVLAWAHAEFPHSRGPLDEGHDWDFDLRGTLERSLDEQLQFDSRSGGFSRAPGGREICRHTVSLALSGSAAFCEAFRAAFDLGVGDDD